MGYCISQRSCQIFIAEEDQEKALEAIKRLNEKVDTLGSDFVDCGGTVTAHYSWVDPSFLDATSLQKILDKWRWEADFDDYGNLVDLWFTGEKLGDDNVLFNAIAPYVRSGSFIEMVGEDGDIWRWYFKDGKCGEVGF